MLFIYDFFSCGPFLKSYLHLLQYCFYFFMFGVFGSPACGISARQPWITPALSASVASRALVIWLHPTLCDPMDYSPPGSSVHAILQARILECVAIPFSRGIFPTQGSNPGLLNCRQILYWLSHQESCTPPELEGKVLTTELPGNSQSRYFLTMNFWSHLCNNNNQNKTNKTKKKQVHLTLRPWKEYQPGNPVLIQVALQLLSLSLTFFTLQ